MTFFSRSQASVKAKRRNRLAVRRILVTATRTRSSCASRGWAATPATGRADCFNTELEMAGGAR
jgi:hypothetical protein